MSDKLTDEQIIKLIEYASKENPDYDLGYSAGDITTILKELLDLRSQVAWLENAGRALRKEVSIAIPNLRVTNSDGVVDIPALRDTAKHLAKAASIVDMRALLHKAEAYIQAWEQVEYNKLGWEIGSTEYNNSVRALRKAQAVYHAALSEKD